MSRLTFDQMNEELDMEFFLQRESLAYRETRGVSGTQLNIKNCPNQSCRDSRWRTYFGVETNRGNCFVCGEGFSKTSFVHKHLGHGDGDWSATATFLTDVLREQGWRPKRAAMAAVTYDNVVLPTSDPLPLENGENLAYLDQRGFGADTCKYFGLRWCQFGWWKFKDADGVVQTQNFANRVIIPVFDLDGDLKTFQGRDLSGTSTKKYLFPMELPGTGRYLLNGQNVLATDHVIMGEGAFDVAAIKLAFDEDPQLRNVVAVGSFGKHLSYGSPDGDDQLGRFVILKGRGLKIVTIMWDGEENALTAALNAAKLLTGIGLIVRVALLPFEKDPNEVLPEVVRKAHYEAQTYSTSMAIKLKLHNPYAARFRAA